jgi:hypothetical protein
MIHNPLWSNGIELLHDFMLHDFCGLLDAILLIHDSTNLLICCHVSFPTPTIRISSRFRTLRFFASPMHYKRIKAHALTSGSNDDWSTRSDLMPEICSPPLCAYSSYLDSNPMIYILHSAQFDGHSRSSSWAYDLLWLRRFSKIQRFLSLNLSCFPSPLLFYFPSSLLFFPSITSTLTL